MDKIILNCHDNARATLFFSGQGGARVIIGELTFDRDSIDAFVECMSGNSSKAEFLIEDINQLFYRHEEEV